MCQYEALFQPRVAAFGFSVIIVGTGLLGGRPLSRSKNVTQKKQKVRCELSALTPKARDDVTDLVSGTKKGTLDAGTKKRIAQPWLYLKDHACFPKALVTMQ